MLEPRLLSVELQGGGGDEEEEEEEEEEWGVCRLSCLVLMSADEESRRSGARRKRRVGRGTGVITTPRKGDEAMGWFSPGQVFVLDEYCARYGVRGCHRHLSYLKGLMDYSENSTLVDPMLLHYSYAFCVSHVHGNRPDGMGTVTAEEKEEFEAIRSRLMALLEYQITHFRYDRRLIRLEILCMSSGFVIGNYSANF
uniref:calcium-dependent secretion activator 2-like n=1 Tax=Solea senegalensis TaxID=28829 RepID=UPI001CD8C683|nr:calcium-dependent secretion activator 2-like [Solea senegalensis]